MEHRPASPRTDETVVARRVDLRDDLLRLSLVEPLVKDGMEYNAALTWQLL
ncbi:hypothetical protein [Actinacidiphila soli]|uniref:hypothetical protein n=1 Tax=Actinacidiphila soli TaxID=2487275 RepID=UPI0013E2B916|nr:hypothetical protein [Actinacidiphila soli]